MKKAVLFVYSLAIAALTWTGCNQEESVPPLPAGTAIFSFQHTVDNEPLIKNELIYTNLASNQYMITGLKYFISDITFWKHADEQIMVKEWKDIFYIDDDIPSTTDFQIFDPIPAGDYDSVTFIFGISGEKNKSFMFLNPPEVNMSWPDVLGGGYHYMMIDGKWKDLQGVLQPYNFHLGIGQLYHGNDYNVDSIYAFVQNCFTVTLPGSSFSIGDKDTLAFILTMHIESWFETPLIFDFNSWGGAIMQNQAAMAIVKGNGQDVFSLRISR